VPALVVVTVTVILDPAPSEPFPDIAEILMSGRGAAAPAPVPGPRAKAAIRHITNPPLRGV
jgi:hypothetical protein